MLLNVAESSTVLLGQVCNLKASTDFLQPNREKNRGNLPYLYQTIR